MKPKKEVALDEYGWPLRSSDFSGYLTALGNKVSEVINELEASGIEAYYKIGVGFTVWGDPDKVKSILSKHGLVCGDSDKIKYKVL